MTSSIPYTMSLDNTHMYNIRDRRGPLPKKLYHPSSITSYLRSDPDLTKAYYMLKLARLEDIYDAEQANFTLFVPSDKYMSDIPEGIFTNMDSGTARAIIQSMTLRNKITAELLAGSGASRYITMNHYNKLYITSNNNDVYVNSNALIVSKDIELENGIVHVINKLITPVIV